MPQTLLVTGANGHLGRLVVENLLNGGHRVIAASRNTSGLADLAARGVEVRVADFDKPETLSDAFAGVDRLLLISTDALGRRLAQHQAAIEAAEKAGVKHILYTSIPSPRPNPDNIVEDDHFWTEQMIFASSMSWTILRHGLYTDNLLMGLPHAIATGTYATATGNKGRHLVTREDCARVDAAALVSSDTSKKIYEITGPAAVTAEEIAALVSELSGKPVQYLGVTGEQIRQAMLGAGLPPVLASAMAGFDLATADGFHGTVTSHVKDLTGQEPTTVKAFLRAHRDALIAG